MTRALLLIGLSFAIVSCQAAPAEPAPVQEAGPRIIRIGHDDGVVTSIFCMAGRTPGVAFDFTKGLTIAECPHADIVIIQEPAK